MAMTLYATNIYSNNGSTLLWSGALENSITITVNSDNVGFFSSERFSGVWQYQGGRTFVGLATSVNATSATYPANGTSFTTAQSTLNLYIVESGGGGTVSVEPNVNATPNAAGKTITPSTGYDAMAQVTLSGDVNLVASNVKKNVTIFDVTGTYEGEGISATLNYGTTQPSSPSEGDLWIDTTGDPEGDISPAQLRIKYNEQTIFFDDEIDSELIKTLTTSGKVMSGNVEVGIVPGTGSIKHYTKSISVVSDVEAATYLSLMTQNELIQEGLTVSGKRLDQYWDNFIVILRKTNFHDETYENLWTIAMSESLAESPLDRSPYTRYSLTHVSSSSSVSVYADRNGVTEGGAFITITQNNGLNIASHSSYLLKAGSYELQILAWGVTR